jgi:hypothetical protein
MIGIDTAKNVFEVLGRNAGGEVVLRRRPKRAQMEKFFADHPKAMIGMEAGGAIDMSSSFSATIMVALSAPVLSLPHRPCRRSAHRCR